MQCSVVPMRHHRLYLAAVLVGACARSAPPEPIFPDAPTLAEAEAETLLVVDPATSRTPTAVEPGEPEPEEKPPLALASLVGTYRYRGGKSSVGDAIDTVVDEMSVISRGIARKRLVASNRVPSRVVISQIGDEVTVRFDGRAYVADLGGESRRVRAASGEVSRLRYQLRDGALRQTFRTDEGERTNTFTRQPDGRLTMSVRIHSGKLPADVRYRLTFEPAS